MPGQRACHKPTVALRSGVFGAIRSAVSGAGERFFGYRRLVTPYRPTLALLAGKQFKERPSRARLDYAENFVRFAAVLALSSGDQIHLGATGFQCPSILPTHPKQDEFGNVAEIESDATAIRSAVFANFIPSEIGFVGEAPSFHDVESLLK